MNNILYQLVKPKSQDEDSKRREFILNVILLGSIFLSFIGLSDNTINILISHKEVASPPWFLFLMFLGFVGLYKLSREGFYKTASYLLILIYFIPISYSFYIWGILTPQGLLIYALIIFISGILISSRFSFFVTFISASVLIFLGYCQDKLISTPDISWKNRLGGMDDAITFSVTLLIIALISWLHNREITKALKRARKAEHDVRKERDSLDVKVKKRTQELKEEQTKRVSQLYHFYEFGQLSAGIFHDLINKLNALSLNVEQLASERGIKNPLESDVRIIIDRASRSLDNVEKFIKAAQKQLKKGSVHKIFSIIREIKDCFLVIDYRATKGNIDLKFVYPKDEYQDITICGDQFKFNQIIVNLLCNALDSYEGLDRKNRRCEIRVSLDKTTSNVHIAIQDWGKGIRADHMRKIFDAFFTTKKSLGLGLATAKKIVEKNFHGSIEVESIEGEGTTFTLKIPTETKKEHKNKKEKNQKNNAGSN